jgi:RNA polymerase sigma-70 factor, ECF subfamily
MSVDHPLEATEVALLARLRQGDREVLGELFGLHRPRLWRMIRFRMDRRLLVRMDADDVLQEAFLAGSRRIESFLSEPDASLFIWLRLIVMQTLCDLHRHHVGVQKRDARRDVSLSPQTDGSRTSLCLATLLAGTITSPSQAAAALELMGRLEQAIGSMAEIDQEIIALRHFEDLTNLETAEVLGITPQAASNRYVRAIARLKEILAPFREPNR